MRVNCTLPKIVARSSGSDASDVNSAGVAMCSDHSTLILENYRVGGRTTIPVVMSAFRSIVLRSLSDDDSKTSTVYPAP